VFSFSEEHSRMEAAMTALRLLGPEAAPAAPELQRLAAATNNGMAAQNALLGLTCLGQEGLVPLLAVVTNNRAALRIQAALYLGVLFRHDTNALPALPVLLGYLTNRDPLMGRGAAAALSNLGLEPELVVPALTNCLSSSDPQLRRTAALALTRFGPAARAALPALTTMPENSDLFFRAATARWLRELSAETEEKPVIRR
jgi:HEAT repeat protein